MRPIHYFIVCILVAVAPRLRADERLLVINTTETRIDVAVKATVDSFVGHLQAFESEIAVGDDGTVSRATVKFRFRDLATGKDGRDKAMHKWQETEKFPDGIFVLSGLEPGAGGNATANGRLAIHGVVRDIRFPVSLQRDGSRYAIDGDAPVDTREFGLPVIRMFGLLNVDPIVHVRFHVQGTTDQANKPAQISR